MQSAASILGSTAILDGDIKAADLLVSVQQHCQRMPESEEGMRRWARRATEFHERSQGQRSSFYSLFDPQPTEEENLAQIQRWSGACQELKKVWDSSIQKDLARLAEQGNVSARLLFAMFPPQADTAAGGVVPFNEKFAWEALAREYSWLNLQAGAPEGLLAFGQSYLNGLFTRHDFILGAAFLKAAMECGQTELASGSIVTRIENADSSSWRGSGPEQQLQLQIYYEGIISYCR
jgi:hypothetical protein